jgi:hypothetical protein
VVWLVQLVRCSLFIVHVCCVALFALLRVQVVVSMYLFVYFLFPVCNFDLIHFNSFMPCFRLYTPKHILVSQKWNPLLLLVARMLLSFISSTIHVGFGSNVRNKFVSLLFDLSFCEYLGSTHLLKSWNTKKLCELPMLWKFSASMFPIFNMIGLSFFLRPVFFDLYCFCFPFEYYRWIRVISFLIMWIC